MKAFSILIGFVCVLFAVTSLGDVVKFDNGGILYHDDTCNIDFKISYLPAKFQYGGTDYYIELRKDGIFQVTKTSLQPLVNGCKAPIITNQPAATTPPPVTDEKTQTKKETTDNQPAKQEKWPEPPESKTLSNTTSKKDIKEEIWGVRKITESKDKKSVTKFELYHKIKTEAATTQ